MPAAPLEPICLRWGIISAGAISYDWAHSFHAYLSPLEHKIVGVAARDVTSAHKFAIQTNIPRVFDSYEDLMKSDEIDVVYIGSVHPAHLALGKQALDHGKHVLCEKPLCVNTRETLELVNYARQKKLFLMEAYWSRFFPAMVQLREELAKGTIGEVVQVTAGIGANFEGNWRESDKEVCAGGVLDIGSYPIQLVSQAFGGERPTKIIAGGHLNEYGIDVSASATILFAKGRTATIQTNCKVPLANDATIVGTKGILRLKAPFWASTELVTPEETFAYELPVVSKKLNFLHSEGLAYQCDEVRRCILAGLTESPIVSLDESIVIAELRETIRKQVGVFYPQDEV